MAASLDSSSKDMKVKIGIIGGTGLDDPDIIEGRTEKDVDTPFGKPSDSLIVGTIRGVDCILIARHGRTHNINPTYINYRANLWALKQEGCTHVLATTACGSLQEDIAPGDIVILDQFIDRTMHRSSTFYDGSAAAPEPYVCHLEMAHPFCEETRKILIESAKELGIKCHPTGTTLTIEGPRFSTKAESLLWRRWGAHCINMTSVPEVPLAKELGLCYGAIALPTDYDSWHETHEVVSQKQVSETFARNASKAKQMLTTAVPKIASTKWDEVIEKNKKKIKESLLYPS